MGDERTAPEKATITLVYNLVGDLRKEVNQQFLGFDEKFDEIRAAIESLRDEIPTRRECQYRHEEVDASILSAVNASKDDRQKLWDAVHDMQSQLKWGAGIIIVAFLGLVVASL